MERVRNFINKNTTRVGGVLLSASLLFVGCRQTQEQFTAYPAKRGATAIIILNEVPVNEGSISVSINCGVDEGTPTPAVQIQNMHDSIVANGTNPNSVYPVNLMALKYSPLLASICLDK